MSVLIAKSPTGPGGFRAPVYVALSMNGSESENENGNGKISN